MICTFVDDKNCKHIPFFLSSLYVFTGDIVRSEDIQEIEKLKMLLDKVTISAESEELTNWINRSKGLIKQPNTYNYAYWGLGSKYVKWER